jgi:hypothetical protein
MRAEVDEASVELGRKQPRLQLRKKIKHEILLNWQRTRLDGDALWIPCVFLRSKRNSDHAEGKTSRIFFIFVKRIFPNSKLVFRITTQRQMWI